MEINRSWSMPNKQTFDIPPIKKLIYKYFHENSCDAFANKNRIAKVTNDLDPKYKCQFNLDALDFYKSREDKEFDFILYDPPYSPRQVSECYTSLGMTVNMQTTQSSYWSDQKREISRITKDGGICMTFGWNSGGIGKKYGFEIIEILLVAHGGWHNDTIVTVERKIKEKQIKLF